MAEKNNLDLPLMKLVGITARTNNKNEMDPSLAKISGMIQKYLSENISSYIENRKKPFVTFAVYTEYENDYMGDYTYFIGEEVTDFTEYNPFNLEYLSIPAQNYTKYTSNSGPMPAVCIDLWKKIWASSEEDMGGKRSYIADFEVYDERAMDPNNTILDIYIGIDKR